MKNKEEFIINFLSFFKTNRKATTIAMKNYFINDKKIERNEFNRMLGLIENNEISELNTFAFVHIYKAMEENGINNELISQDIEYYFTKEEILDALNEIKERREGIFPIQINNVEQLSDKEEYSFCLSVQEIAKLEKSGIIKIIEGMQRESVATIFGDKIVSHVKYNDKAAQSIKEQILNDRYYPTSLRWHIVLNDDISADYKYDKKNKTLTINDCLIAEIDGQHRSAAILYALAINPNINLKFNIILTVGEERLAQFIINQDEQRQPIDLDHLLVFSQSVESNIVSNIKTRLQQTEWKFFSTKVENEQNEDITRKLFEKIRYIYEPDFIKILQDFIYITQANKTEQQKIENKFVKIFKIIDPVEIEEYVERQRVLSTKYIACYVSVIAFLEDEKFEEFIYSENFIKVLKQYLKDGKERFGTATLIKQINKRLKENNVDFIFDYGYTSKIISYKKEVNNDKK